MQDECVKPGRILGGRYRLEAPLGGGGMSAVWRAEDCVLTAPVAVKMLDRDILGSEEAELRFEREAKAAAALRSAHVVQTLDYGVDDGQPYMVMELLEGETLRQRLKRASPLAPEEVARIFTHVGRAITRAHDAGIIHRDLKPENIFLVENEDESVAKVLDFGVAKVDSGVLGPPGAATQTGSLLGTPHYMSPEQALGNKTVDHRSDLWSLAVIAFECLVGKRPFTSDALGDLVVTICVRPIPVPSEHAAVPAGFDRWFARAVQRSPDLRFQSAREMVESLRECLDDGYRVTVTSDSDVDSDGYPLSALANAPEPTFLDQPAKASAPTAAQDRSAAPDRGERVADGGAGQPQGPSADRPQQAATPHAGPRRSDEQGQAPDQVVADEPGGAAATEPAVEAETSRSDVDATGNADSDSIGVRPLAATAATSRRGRPYLFVGMTALVAGLATGTLLWSGGWHELALPLLFRTVAGEPLSEEHPVQSQPAVPSEVAPTALSPVPAEVDDQQDVSEESDGGLQAAAETLDAASAAQPRAAPAGRPKRMERYDPVWRPRPDQWQPYPTTPPPLPPWDPRTDEPPRVKPADEPPRAKPADEAPPAPAEPVVPDEQTNPPDPEQDWETPPY
jgi:serine/threonine protein kinase